MSRQTYSGRSFDRSKLSATYGALKGLYPQATVTVSAGGTSKEGEEALLLLASELHTESSIKFSVRSTNSDFTVQFAQYWDLVIVDVSLKDKTELQRVHDVVRGTLGLTNPTPEELDSEASLYSINQRVLRLQNLISELPSKIILPVKSARLRCFVSFRYDEHSKALALELRNFLELAGFEFISGLGYEPRSVSEKVLERLKDRLDLFIVIFAAGGDSAWLHQEIGVAKGRRLPVMVLKEDGASFNEGLLSDTEYASFPKDQISGAFIPVLQAVQYIRLKEADAQHE